MKEEGGWLLRQSDLVLGPVPASHIIDKLYSGELTAASEVQRLGGSAFRRLSEIPDFKVHVAKAEAKARVEAQARAHHAEQRKKLIRAASITGAVLLVVAVGVAVLGSYLAVHTPSGKTAEELAYADITIDAPTVKKARRALDDELVDYTSPGAPRRPTTTAARVDPRTPARPGETKTPGPGPAEPDGLEVGAVDEAAITAVVAKHKPTLIPCIKQLARTGVVGRVPIEFAITETGRVSRVWVDNPELKDSGLTECLLKELEKWPFKAGPSGASVALSFNIGRAG